MAFQLWNKKLRYQEAILDHKEVECFHYILEESSNPEDKAECGPFATYLLQRLEEVVELTVNNNTTNYPCLVKCGHIVPYAYGRCHFLKAPRRTTPPSRCSSWL